MQRIEWEEYAWVVGGDGTFRARFADVPAGVEVETRVLFDDVHAAVVPGDDRIAWIEFANHPSGSHRSAADADGPTFAYVPRDDTLAIDFGSEDSSETRSIPACEPYHLTVFFHCDARGRVGAVEVENASVVLHDRRSFSGTSSS